METNGYIILYNMQELLGYYSWERERGIVIQQVTLSAGKVRMYTTHFNNKLYIATDLNAYAWEVMHNTDFCTENIYDNNSDYVANCIYL